MPPSPSSPDSPELVLIDGSGHRYRVANYRATFLLVSEVDGHLATVDVPTLQRLGIEWNGKQLQPVGGSDAK